jgi:hypothetical protein
MSYVYVASSGLILIFIFLILRRKRKSNADYLLIGINVLIGCFMLADVFIQWKLTSETVVFQNVIPLLLFPTFLGIYYNLPITIENSSRLVFTLFSCPCFIDPESIDHYVLLKYNNQYQTISMLQLFGVNSFSKDLSSYLLEHSSCC